MAISLIGFRTCSARAPEQANTYGETVLKASLVFAEFLAIAGGLLLIFSAHHITYGAILCGAGPGLIEGITSSILIYQNRKFAVARKNQLEIEVARNNQLEIELGKWVAASPQAERFNRQGAASEIKFCCQNNKTSLDLNFKALTTLPDVFSYLTQLTDLDLSSNKLTVLPDAIGNLHKLQFLYLNRNSLTELPDAIGNLTQLCLLDLSGNQLIGLPDAIGNLSKLNELYLSGNSLIGLPDAIRNLTQLDILNLSGNSLIGLPDAIRNLSKLSKLNLSGNRLAELPDAIRNLTDLRELDLSGNRLAELPDAIGHLGQLRELNLSGNLLRGLPDAIRNLSKLYELNLSDNHLTVLPDAIGHLSKLDTLNLSGNQLTVSPAEIGHLILLRELSKLDLSGNQLIELPVEIGHLIQLDTLNLSGNHLTVLPAAIWDLNKLYELEELDLSGNHLTVLPDTIWHLTDLRELNLKNNRLTGLPNTICSLSQCCVVGLEGNAFTLNVVRRIQNHVNHTGYQGPRMIFSIRENNNAVERSLEELLKNLCVTAGKEPITLTHLVGNGNLKSWLNRLMSVGDYRNNATRKNLAELIYNAIVLAEIDKEFREVFLNCIAGAAATCGDRMALSILYLGINLKIKKNKEEKNYQEMAYLLWHGTYALSELEKIAQIKEATLWATDPIEVYLAYPVQLKEALCLPIDIESMLYFACSGVTKKDLENAKNDLTTMLFNWEEFLEFLVKQQDWEDLLKMHVDYKGILEARTAAGKEVKKKSDYGKIQEDYLRKLTELTKKVLSGMTFPFWSK